MFDLILFKLMIRARSWLFLTEARFGAIFLNATIWTIIIIIGIIIASLLVEVIFVFAWIGLWDGSLHQVDGALVDGDALDGGEVHDFGDDVGKASDCGWSVRLNAQLVNSVLVRGSSWKISVKSFNHRLTTVRYYTTASSIDLRVIAVDLTAS